MAKVSETIVTVSTSITYWTATTYGSILTYIIGGGGCSDSPRTQRRLCPRFWFSSVSSHCDTCLGFRSGLSQLISHTHAVMIAYKQVSRMWSITTSMSVLHRF